MIATLTLISTDGEKAAYNLEIPGEPDRILEVGPHDVAAIRGDINDAAIHKAMVLIEYLELADFAMVKLKTFTN